MADVITRFKLETSQYDSKLRDAAKGLKEVVRQAELGGAGFSNFSQKSVEAARALGTIESGANNTKDKLKDLVGSFNDAARAYNNLSQQQQQSDFGKAMSQSLTQLQERIKETKNELYSLGDATKQMGGGGGGGFLDMMSVAGGNLIAQGISKIGSEMADAVKQSVELARQGEGIRMAFERLNRPGLLDNLKEATHGTVSEIELMQQAIKFENFKLPLEDLATYLSFAQQKAKDTGESIDYLVNSIVNGLGRQSKQILDNLGISAAELTRRMNEGADMTKAVADIIREEMEKAGDYVETAADRAARAAADTKNKMEELGREAQPFADAWTEVWTEISIGGMDFLTKVLGPIAESAKSIRNILNGDFKIKPGIENLADGPSKKGSAKKPTWGDVPVYTAPGGYVEVTDANTGAVLGGQHFDNLADTNAINTWRKSLTKSTTSKTRTGKTTAELVAWNANKAYLAGEKAVDPMPSVWGMLGDQGLRDMMGIGKQQVDINRVLKSYVDPNVGKPKTPTDDPYKFANDFSKIVGGVGNITAGLQTLGVDLPEGFTKTIAAIQTISGILTAILAITSAIEAAATVDATASTIDAIIPFARGGKIPRAATGYYVPGTRYSGDTTLIRANAGELILNQSSQNNLAADLQHAQALVGMINSYQSSFMERQQMGNDAAVVGGGVAESVNRQPYMTGEMIFLGLNTYLESTGRGELLTSRFK